MKKMSGFSLVELMVVMAIAAIIAVFGYPVYTKQVAKGRRVEAQKNLLELAQSLEAKRTSAGTYVSVSVPTGTYYIFSQAMLPPAITYTLTATRKGVMVGDECGDFTLTSTGVRANIDATVSTGCWTK